MVTWFSFGGTATLIFPLILLARSCKEIDVEKAKIIIFEIQPIIKDKSLRQNSNFILSPSFLKAVNIRTGLLFNKIPFANR